MVTNGQVDWHYDQERLSFRGVRYSCGTILIHQTLASAASGGSGTPARGRGWGRGCFAGQLSAFTRSISVTVTIPWELGLFRFAEKTCSG